jgi:hypothetical protein
MHVFDADVVDSLAIEGYRTVGKCKIYVIELEGSLYRVHSYRDKKYYCVKL